MKYRILLTTTLLLLLTVQTIAQTIKAPPLPVSPYSDKESTACYYLLKEIPEATRNFRLEMVFTGTQTNNIEVALGSDTLIEDGKLDAAETAMIIGWDSGEWFMRTQGLHNYYTTTAETNHTPHSLTLSLRRRAADNFWHSPAIYANQQEVQFSGLDFNPLPEWLQPDLWNLMRITVRGYDNLNETIRTRFLPDGTLLIMH